MNRVTMAFPVNLKYNLYIVRGETVEGFFYKGELILLEVFGGESVRYANDKLVVPIAQPNRFTKPGAVVRLTHL